MSDRTDIPDTRHRWSHPASIPPRQTSTWFTYPNGVKGWVDIGGWLYTDSMVVTHPSSTCWITTYLGVKHMIAWSYVQSPIFCYTPNHLLFSYSFQSMVMAMVKTKKNIVQMFCLHSTCNHICNILHKYCVLYCVLNYYIVTISRKKHWQYTFQAAKEVRACHTVPSHLNPCM